MNYPVRSGDTVKGGSLETLGIGSGVTLGICTVDEGLTTARLVDSALRSSTSPELSVVVVTPSSAVARTLSREDGRLKVVLERNREGKASAMNKLLQNVREGVLVYASGDIAMGQGTVGALVNELMSTPQCGAVIGHVVVANKSDGIMGKVSSLIWGLFNRISQKLDGQSRLAQSNDLYAVRRDAISFIPSAVVNDDTYLMMSVKRRGLLVKKTNVPFYISGPSTPFDYVVQRSRITLGHMQTIETLGTTPTIFQFSAMRNMDIFVAAVSSEGPWGVVAALTALPLELISWVWAGIMSLTGRSARKWRMVAGTKAVLEHLGSEPKRLARRTGSRDET